MPKPWIVCIRAGTHIRRNGNRRSSLVISSMYLTGRIQLNPQTTRLARLGCYPRLSAQKGGVGKVAAGDLVVFQGQANPGSAGSIQGLTQVENRFPQRVKQVNPGTRGFFLDAVTRKSGGTDGVH